MASGQGVHAEFAGVAIEDLFVNVAGGGVDVDFVPDAAEEGIVNEVLRVEVCREDDELLEGDLELLAAGDGEEIVPVFERQNPAVEEFLGRRRAGGRSRR